MSDKVGLVRVLTSATGNSTPITLGVAYSQLFMTPAEAGAVDGRTYTWLLVDGNNWELVKGAYTASGTTAARTTVIASRSGGTLGTSRITLSGTAQVRIVESAVDMDGVRGTRSVAGTSDALAATDLGYVVTYSNAAAVAVSLAQAGTASLYDGWATWVQNLGVGMVTITPATSTINGATTLPLATNMGAFIWSDGTNYHAYFLPVSKPLLAANNGSDAANVDTMLSNLHGVSYGASQSLTSAQQAQARANIAVPAANVLINADFRVNQMAYVSTATLAAGVYGHDQWKAGASGGDYSFTQLGSSTQITIATSKSLIQPIESANVVGGSYVLSWTGTAQARFGVNTLTPSGTYASSPILITGQTAATAMSVEFNTGTLGTVKLELGASATPFIMRPFDQELLACRRHYYRLSAGVGGSTGYASGLVLNSTLALFSIVFPGMRVTPTLTFSSVSDFQVLPNATNPSAISLSGATPNSARLDLTVSGFTTGTGSVLQGTSSSWMAFDARL
jgi:hypothetical protein